MSYNFYLFISVIFFSISGQNYFQGNDRRECIECHGDLLKKKNLHSDLETTCDICHSPTGAEHPKPGTMGFKLTENLPALCFNCHSDLDENVSKAAVIHLPFNDKKSCINCHSPHSSDNEKILLKGSVQLCLSCHNREIKTDSLRLENISQLLKSGKSVHPPIETDGCVICHNPHFADRLFLLSGNFPSGTYVKATPENFDLCFTCHDSELMVAENTETSTNFRNGKKNLHYVHITGDKGRNCDVCHDVHGAPNERLIKNTFQFGNWSMNLNYKINENGGSCSTGCHGLKKYNRLSPETNN